MPIIIVPMAQIGVGKNHTLAIPPKDSSMTYDEGEELFFWMSNLEQNIKESVKHIDLSNLKR